MTEKFAPCVYQNDDGYTGDLENYRYPRFSESDKISQSGWCHSSTRINSPKAERVSDACTEKAGPLQYDIEVKPPWGVPISSGQGLRQEQRQEKSCA